MTSAEISAIREQVIEFYKKAWTARAQAVEAYNDEKKEFDDSSQVTRLFEEKDCWDEVVYKFNDLVGVLLNAQCFAERREQEGLQ